MRRLRACWPHAPLVNAAPLLNFTTMWKLVGAHIASQYVPDLAWAGFLPCTRFALHASFSVVDLLRSISFVGNARVHLWTKSGMPMGQSFTPLCDACCDWPVF